MKVIKAKKITKKNFSKFGQLIDTSKKILSILMMDMQKDLII